MSKLSDLLRGVSTGAAIEINGERRRWNMAEVLTLQEAAKVADEWERRLDELTERVTRWEVEVSRLRDRVDYRQAHDQYTPAPSAPSVEVCAGLNGDCQQTRDHPIHNKPTLSFHPFSRYTETDPIEGATR